MSTMRIGILDQARGFALLAMTGFHFCWDLTMFGQLPPSIMAESGMIWFARSIAGTFLFIVGVSLVLATQNGVHPTKVGWRLVKIAAAAAIITLATWYATPDAFIFFGILHQIAFASVIGLAFVSLPWAVTAGVAFFVLLARPLLATPDLDAPVVEVRCEERI